MRTLRKWAVAVLACALPALACAQSYPAKPIRFIVPYTPGGSTSNVARLVAQHLSESVGQPVVVDNRPGGNTVIGTEGLAKSPPDGYTILLVANTHAISPSLIAKLPYDPVRDFTPVATLVTTRLVLVVHPSLTANSLHEFLALAKARPGQLNFGSASMGGATHLAGELFNSVAGVRTVHVAYKGTAPMLTDLLGGRLQFALDTPITSIPHVRAGRLRALAITGKGRLAALPEVPSFEEAGLPAYAMEVWFAVLAPARTPQPIVARLNAEINRILTLAPVRETLLNQGLETYLSTPEQLDALIRSDIDKFAGVVRAADIKLE